jgi:hypothetical protein
MKKSERSRKAWAKWRKLVLQQARSGQDVAGFCRERGLCAPHFFAWKKKLSQAAAPQLVEVSVAAKLKESESWGGLVVVLGRERKIRVPAGFAEAELQRLVSLLERM